MSLSPETRRRPGGAVWGGEGRTGVMVGWPGTRGEEGKAMQDSWVLNRLS